MDFNSRICSQAIRWVCFTLCVLALLASSDTAAQQPADQRTDQAGTAMMQLTLPDAITLDVLADLVSERLGLQIVYDEELRQERIVVKAPNQMPEQSLLPLLESILKIRGYSLIDADVAGWKRILKAKSLTEIARSAIGQPLNEIPLTEAITQAFTLENVSARRLEELIKPFLTDPGANTILLAEQNTLIVTDYVSNIQRINMLATTIDIAGPRPSLKFYTVKHVEASALQSQITQVLAAQTQIPGTAESHPALKITADPRTNQLLLTGALPQIEEAILLANALDVPLDLVSEVYEFRFINPARIDRLVKDLLDPLTVERLYRSSVDEADNLLVVSAPAEIHERIRDLKARLDIEAQQAGSALQFYRLKYADAAEVLQTIFAIQQTRQQGPTAGAAGVSPTGRGRFNGIQYGTPQGVQERFVPGPNTPPAPGSSDLPTPPALIPSSENAPNPSVSPGSVPPGMEGADTPSGLLSSAAQVTADLSSNSLIVVADRPTQQQFAELIKFLDRRRPQVMIEAKVVILDTTNSYALGIELSGGDRKGPGKLFNFTSFGLSTVNATNGALALNPGLGYNLTLVEPDVADVVLRALSTHTKARVMSAPRVLVNDNATGTLASVSEVPFTSVNASNTVATTSFAGFAEAGTTIQATPRISDEHELQLDFVVTLNSFTGPGSAGVPPPRQTNEVASSVTVPDGYTVIVGGLNQKNESFNQSAIPFVERIPVLRDITSSTTKSNNQNTLFVFLRPVILTNDKFEDLKYISDRDLRPSGLRANFPTSQPVVVR